MQNVPDNVIAFKATGKVTGGDYENVLIPAMEAALEKHNKVRALGLISQTVHHPNKFYYFQKEK